MNQPSSTTTVHRRTHTSSSSSSSSSEKNSPTSALRCEGKKCTDREGQSSDETANRAKESPPAAGATETGTDDARPGVAAVPPPPRAETSGRPPVAGAGAGTGAGAGAGAGEGASSGLLRQAGGGVDVKGGDSSRGLVAHEPEPLYAIVFSVAPPAKGGEPVQLLSQVCTCLNRLWWSRIRLDPRSRFSLDYCCTVSPDGGLAMLLLLQQVPR